MTTTNPMNPAVHDSSVDIRPGRLLLGSFVAALGLGVIILQIIEEDAGIALPFALLVSALTLIGALLSRRKRPA